MAPNGETFSIAKNSSETFRLKNEMRDAMRATGKRRKMEVMAKNHAQAFEAMDVVVDGSRTGWIS